MTLLLWIVVAALAVDVGLIGGLLGWRMYVAANSASILDLGPLLVAAGVLTALIAFLANIRRARSEDLLEAAVDLIEKGYEKLAPEDESKQPSNNRFAWLSAARLIATAERLGIRITEKSHRLIYREKKEYWRIRLYELIFPSVDGLPETFYAEKPEHMIGYSGRVRDPLSEKSLAYLYRFIKWPDRVPDPIGEEPKFSDQEIDKMISFGPRGLGKLMAEVRRLERRGQPQ